MIKELPEDLPFEEKVKLFNEYTQELYDWLGVKHPSLNVQLVPADEVAGNDYNPNKVAAAGNEAAETLNQERRCYYAGGCVRHANR